MQDDLVPLLAIAGVGLVATAVCSQIFAFFIALTATPFRRAAWTAGLGYWAATAAVMVFLGEAYLPGDPPQFNPYAAPLYCLPSGLLALLFWHGEFRRTWFPDTAPVPRGARRMNASWVAGLVFVIMTAVFAAVSVWGSQLVRSL